VAQLAAFGDSMFSEQMQQSDTSGQPLVSIIVASYNYGRYIGRTLQSILDQTIQDFEIIVVDDASTDDSQEIVRSFGDARIRLFVNEKNIGVVATYNRAVSLAQGEFLAYCDSDDWIEPRKIEEQIAYIRLNPGVDIVTTYLKFVDADGQRHASADEFETTYNQPFDFNAVDTWAAGSRIFGGTIMLPRAIHLQIGPRDNTMAVASDFELHSRAYAKGFRFGLVPLPLVVHRLSEGSASSKNPIITFLEGIYVLQKNILPMIAAKSALHLIPTIINDTVIGAQYHSLNEDQRDRLLAILMSPTKSSNCAAFKEACLNDQNPTLLSLGRRLYASFCLASMHPLRFQEAMERDAEGAKREEHALRVITALQQRIGEVEQLLSAASERSAEGAEREKHALRVITGLQQRIGEVEQLLSAASEHSAEWAEREKHASGVITGLQQRIGEVEQLSGLKGGRARADKPNNVTKPRRIQRGYAAYYNVSRTHRSLNKDAPLHRAIECLGAVIS
jgi:glycosyltransferase involved in cell wall biosynthesis